jgi:uncharacterized protein (DUF1697 family)
MAIYVTFLKGINVGGKNLIAMKSLVHMFDELGYTNVRSYLQSGNICFESRSRDARGLERNIAGALAKEAGRDIAVMVRSGTALRAIVMKNPFVDEATREPHKVFVGFLSAEPEKSALQALGEIVTPGERFAVHETEMFLHLSNGAGRSKITTAVIERKLRVAVTMRNMNTVLALVEECG